LLCVVDDIAQAFASVEEDLRESEPCPDETAVFPSQFSSMPTSTSQGEGYPPETTSNVYPAGTAPALYPPGTTPMLSSMMAGRRRDFDHTRSNFQLEDHAQIYQQDQTAWQSRPGNDPDYPSVSVPPPSSGIVPQVDMRPATQELAEGNLPV